MNLAHADPLHPPGAPDRSARPAHPDRSAGGGDVDHVAALGYLHFAGPGQAAHRSRGVQVARFDDAGQIAERCGSTDELGILPQIGARISA
ncbi:hypothetical protein SAMN05661080_03505 [Modestobacter sp. DSM 44400]|nr:hypothetical protein SAMN05661080_03505 [Modestobacter sp. DSM 44400]